MSLFFRKTIRSGPFRWNLSKSGVGISAGLKGLTAGASSRGLHVGASVKGIGLRKYLGAPGANVARNSGNSVSGAPLLFLSIAFLAVGAVLLFWVWVLL